MLEKENKLRLVAFFVSTILIILVLCYSIIKEISFSVSFYVIIILTSAFIGILISRIKNSNITDFLIKSFESFINITALANQVNKQQIKNKKQDEDIKSKPFLYFFIVTIIILSVLGFVISLLYQSLRLTT